MKKMTMTFFAALAAASLGAHGEAPAPAGDAARGKAAYLKVQCDSCHGTAGQGTRYGSRLAPDRMEWGKFEKQVRHPRSAMPRYAVEFVSDRDLADIYAYLGSVKPGPKAADIPLLKE